MIHEEKDYDISEIPEEEPVFLLRSTDPVSPRIVELWAKLSYAEGSIDQDKLTDILRHGARMREYNIKNGGMQHITMDDLIKLAMIHNLVAELSE